MNRVALTCFFSSVRPNKFLDAAFHRFDGGNKQKKYFWDQGY
jgi:hypothetical protein